MTTPFDAEIHLRKGTSEVSQFRGILQRLQQKIQRDQVVQTTTDNLRNFLQVNRVVLYYFYKEWEGQVTFEALSDKRYSIFGSTGPDQCFNDEYAELYLKRRVSAIRNIGTDEIAPCHRDFLRHMGVRANLVVPILVGQGSEKSTDPALWGLLVAHHCQSPRTWSEEDINRMQEGAKVLATAASIQQTGA